MTTAPEIDIKDCSNVVLPKQHTGNLTLKQYVRIIRKDEHMMLTEYGKSLVTWNILQCIKDFAKVHKVLGDGSGHDYLVRFK
jgi:hypothetical protein